MRRLVGLLGSVRFTRKWGHTPEVRLRTSLDLRGGILAKSGLPENCVSEAPISL
jgi:hypothetical protein